MIIGQEIGVGGRECGEVRGILLGAPLGVFFVCSETFVNGDRFVAREQGDTVMAFLPVVVHVIAQGLDFG